MPNKSITLIEKDRPLFEQLADVAQASYSSAIGRTRQQDIVRAQLELDSPSMIGSLYSNKNRRLLLKDCPNGSASIFSNSIRIVKKTSPQSPGPALNLIEIFQISPCSMKHFFTAGKEADPQNLYTIFSTHPSVLAIEQQIKARDTGIDLAKQKI